MPYIEIAEFHPRTGDKWIADFNVGDRNVAVGISGTLLAIWNIARNEKMVSLILNQLGRIKIVEMLELESRKVKILPTEIIFTSEDFKKEDGRIMSAKEAVEFLEARAEKACEASSEIGFKQE